MNIWAIADLHLCLSCPNMNMEDFGPSWSNYIQRIKDNWIGAVSPEDLVLLPGDITWARTLEQAKQDLQWIDYLPGKKIMIRGNHDSWWQSMGKIQSILPPSITALQNDAWNSPEFSVGGARLWDTLEYSSSAVIDFKVNPKANPKTPQLTDEDNERIYKKELKRLELSLQKMDPSSKLKIAMTHYPPISFDLKSSKVHQMLKDFQINICVFGHIHNIKPNPPPLFGKKEGINYILSSSDFLQFHPVKILN